MPLDHFVTIDFEASCLPRHGRSFPIEVAIAGPEGASTWLIRPFAGQKGWVWTSEAAALHGIDPARLESEGLPAHQVFAEINRAINGRRIIADSRIDQYWWSVLAGAAGEDADAQIVYVGTILDEIGLSSDDIMAAQDHADKLNLGRHRAIDDARWLWTLLSRLKSMSADHDESVPLISWPTHPSAQFATL